MGELVSWQSHMGWWWGVWCRCSGRSVFILTSEYLADQNRCCDARQPYLGKRRLRIDCSNPSQRSM